MRITSTAVFVVTLLLGWLFFGWLGDFNVYVDFPNGSKMIKSHTTLADRIIGGFVIALVFAALDTAVLRLGQRFCSRKSSRSANDASATSN